MERPPATWAVLRRELLDIDGVTGGFNFQHCWTSGWLARQAIAGSGCN